MTVAKPCQIELRQIMRKWMIRLGTVVLVMGIMYVLGAWLTPPPARSGQSRDSAKGADAQDPKLDRVLAKVNGEEIREGDVSMKMPDGTFGMQGDEARDVRLKRMIRAVTLRQYLAKEKVEVAKVEIDRQVEELRKNPPSVGCMCCSYPSLEQFMQANYLDMKELRAEIANDLGLQKHLDVLWQKEYPAGEKLDEFLRQKREEVEKRHVKVSHIFFNTFQNPDFDMNPTKERRRLRIRAEEVFQRLQKGEVFEDVAKEVSEDRMSRPKGGELGCIPFDTFGRDVERVMRNLKPGDYSHPVESPYGFHVLRREALQDKDVLKVAKDEFLDIKRADVLNNVWMNTKVEYPGK